MHKTDKITPDIVKHIQWRRALDINKTMIKLDHTKKQLSFTLNLLLNLVITILVNVNAFKNERGRNVEIESQ